MRIIKAFSTIFSSPPRWAIFLTAVISFWITFNLNWVVDYWRSVLEADARGYYAYLPALVVYDDLNFGFFPEMEGEKYYDQYLFYDYRDTLNGKTYTKYYFGTALVQLPVYYAAHVFAPHVNEPQDGYSKPYMVSVSFSAWIYMLLGLIFLKGLLQLYEVKPWAQFWLMLATFFGSNLFYYTVSEPGMSHVFSFSFVCLFLLQAKKLFVRYEGWRMIALGAILAIITLIRPINVLVVFALPFLAGGKKAMMNSVPGLRENWTYVLGSAIVFVCLISIQLGIYKLTVGQWWVYSYGEEGFNFMSPHFLDILFSYKKGLFLYTPLYFLGFLAALLLFQENRFTALMWLTFFVFITYVLSSWWMWFYGGSFSSRVYIEFLPLFILPIGILFNRIKRPMVRVMLVSGLVLITVLCQIQTYQYRYYHIHYSEMTKEKYWDVFLRIDKL